MYTEITNVKSFLQGGYSGGRSFIGVLKTSNLNYTLDVCPVQSTGAKFNAINICINLNDRTLFRVMVVEQGDEALNYTKLLALYKGYALLECNQKILPAAKHTAQCLHSDEIMKRVFEFAFTHAEDFLTLFSKIIIESYERGFAKGKSKIQEELKDLLDL